MLYVSCLCWSSFYGVVYVVFGSVVVLFFFFSSRRRHTRCALVTGVQTCALPIWPELDAVLAAAQEGFQIWRRTSPTERAEIILKAARLIREIGRASSRERVCQYV